MISNGLHSSVAELAQEFERTSGRKLAIRYDTAAFLQRDIEGGADFDVTAITGTNFDAVAKARKIVPAIGPRLTQGVCARQSGGPRIGERTQPALKSEPTQGRMS